MIKKRLLIIDYACGKPIAERFNLAYKEIDAVCLPYFGFRRIPQNYDAYLLHLSEIGSEDVELIRKESPLSWIFGVHRSGTHISADVTKDLDRIFEMPSFCSENLFNIIADKIKNYREVKKD